MTTVCQNLVKNLLTKYKMAELLILFLVLICILLIVIGFMYKCTDGTMDTNDFSFDNCFKFGDNKESDDDKPQEAKQTITKSPLLSDDNDSMGSLFGSMVNDSDDDVDYSSYVDYYYRSKRPVYTRDREGVNVVWKRPPRGDYEGKPYIDSLDIDVYDGVGECAKLCYEGDYKLGEDEDDLEHSCNAFKMKTDKKCTLYWSISDKNPNDPDGVDYVYRLKKPKSPADHQTTLEDGQQNGDYALFFDEINYFQSKASDGKKNKVQMTYTPGIHNLERGAKSVIIPEDFCVQGWSGKDGKEDEDDPFDDEPLELNIFNRNFPKDKAIQSFKLGEWTGDECKWKPEGGTDENNVVTVPQFTGLIRESCKARPNRSSDCKDDCSEQNSLSCMRDDREDCCEWS